MTYGYRILSLLLGAAACSESSGLPPLPNYVPAPHDRPPAEVKPPPDDTWENHQGTRNSHPYGLVVDGSGDIIIAGEFYGYSDFGGGLRQSIVSYNGFVAKYDRSGRYLWDRQLTGEKSGLFGLAQDRQGNIAAVGYVVNSVDAGGGLVSVSGWGRLVAKYDRDGRYLWSQPLPEKGSVDAKRVKFDSQGNLYIAGQFGGSPDLGSGPLPGGTRIAVTYVTKLDPNGNMLWDRSIGGGQDSGVMYSNEPALAVDAKDNVFVSGPFWDTQDLGSGPVTSRGNADLFVAKFDASGSYLWATPLGTSGRDDVKDIAVTPQGEALVLAGIEMQPAVRPPQAIAETPGPGLLSRLDANGTPLWSQRLTSTSSSVYLGKLLLEGEQVLLNGATTGSIDFGGVALAAGCGRTFLARFDAGGVPIGSRCFGTSPFPQSFPILQGLAFDSPSRIVMVGEFPALFDLPAHRLDQDSIARMFLARIATEE